MTEILELEVLASVRALHNRIAAPFANRQQSDRPPITAASVAAMLKGKQ